METKFEIKLRRKDGTDSYFEHLTLDDLLNRNGSLFHPNIWEVVYKREATGLKDKHDKEIYEGDILNVSNGSINGTLWMDKPYAVDYRLTKGWNMCMFCWDKEGNNQMDSTHWCEIIGNIYDNPELLTVREEEKINS